MHHNEKWFSKDLMVGGARLGYVKREKRYSCTDNSLYTFILLHALLPRLLLLLMVTNSFVEVNLDLHCLQKKNIFFVSRTEIHIIVNCH